MNETPTADVLRDLAPTGRLRAAINFGNSVLAQRGADGARGVSVDLVCALGDRLGVDTELVSFDAAGKVFDALATDAWDIAFLAIDPTRSAEILFTPPYVLIEGTYLVREDSPLTDPDDVDRKGHWVATGQGSAYDLFLTRTLKHACIERRATAAEAFALFEREGLDAAAGVRQVLLRHAAQRGGLRVMRRSFMTIQQAIGTPRGRAAGARYLAQFIEAHKRAGFVSEALQRSGQTDATVAPSHEVA